MHPLGFNVKELDDKVLLTSVFGAWRILSKEEYESISRKGKVFDMLEECGIIVTEKNVGRLRDRIRSAFSFLLAPPNLHVVVVTDRCDHGCVYCRAKQSERDMDHTTARRVADFILSSSSRFLTIEFQGGESLLNYPMLRYFMEYVEERRSDRVINFRLVSNLSAMDERIFNELMDKRVELSTSLDGPKKLHDRLRPHAESSYDKVVHWIKYAREKSYRISAMPTITRKSLGYGRKIVDEYARLGLSQITLRPVACLGRAAEDWKRVGFSADEFFRFWSDALDYCISLSRGGTPIIEGTTVSILERLALGRCSNMCARSPCGAGISQLAYDPAGDIYPCDSSRGFEEFRIGNVSDVSFRQVIEKTSHLRGISNLTTFCDSCVWSPFCGTCLVEGYCREKSPISIKPRDFGCQLNAMQLEFVVKKLAGEDEDILAMWLKAVFPERLYEPRIYTRKRN
jgi:His-Xaa-Ser system radical SAM maturase HxsB